MKRLLTFVLLAVAVVTPFAAAELTANAQVCMPPAVIHSITQVLS
jgi:hypothetical protein